MLPGFDWRYRALLDENLLSILCREGLSNKVSGRGSVPSRYHERSRHEYSIFASLMFTFVIQTYKIYT